MNFVVQFFKHWRQVGSLFPSSVFLASNMVNKADFKNAKIIIELGPGTGSVTKKILKKMGKDCRLIVFETNKVFCSMLRDLGDERLEVFESTALKMGKCLKGRKADFIFSGIPLANLSPYEKRMLVKNIQNNLKTGGMFVQFQYTLESYALLKSLFEEVKLSFTLLNAPPAFVYTCAS